MSKLNEERVSYHRTIIHCQKCENCADLYIYFENSPESNFTEPQMLHMNYHNSEWLICL